MAAPARGSVDLSRGARLAVALAAVVIIRMLVPDQIRWPSGLALPLLLVASVALLGYIAYVHSTYPDALADRVFLIPDDESIRIDVAAWKTD